MPLFPFHLRSFDRPGDTTPARPNASTPIGVISMVIAALTLAVAWIPYFGMLAVPVAALGALLGFAGIIVGRVAGQRKVFLPFIGMLLCGVSIAVSYGSTIAWQNRSGAPGRGFSTPTPAPPPVDMRGVTGPFVPRPVTQPTFVIPHIDTPSTAPS